MNLKCLFFATGLLLLLGSGCSWNDDESLFGCIDGEGPTTSDELLLDDFTKIKLKIAADVYLTQGDVQEVIVEGQQNIIHRLDLDIQGETWEIELDGCVDDYDELKIYITIPEIKELNISGSGMIYGENEFSVGDLRLRISGSGDIDLVGTMEDIDAKISGSGKIKLAGSADSSELKISGSGDYRTFDMEVKDAELDISGSGDAEVRVTEDLEIKISGSGDVYYKGEPELDIDISGSGDVIDAN